MQIFIKINNINQKLWKNRNKKHRLRNLVKILMDDIELNCNKLITDKERLISLL